MSGTIKIDGSSIFEDLSEYRNYLNFGNAKPSKKVESTDIKKLKPSERLLKEIEGNGFDLTEMGEVLKTRGNQLIVSCAGSGKTTALTFKILYDIKSGWATKVQDFNGSPMRVPEKIWVCTFLKTGAEELEASLCKWQSKLHCVDVSPAISFSTLHAEFKRALIQAGKPIILIDAKENTKFLKEVVQSYALTNGRGRALTSEDYNSLEGALVNSRNRLDESRYINDVYDEMNLTAPLIDSIIDEWAYKRKQSGCCDFEDLQEIIYKECYINHNEELANFLANRYSFIYIDEFQDTSQIQYKVLQIYARNCKQVNAIGDDDQTIYSWRGSDNDIILNKFKEDFSPTISNLSVNFRCPSNILDAIKPSIENNKGRFAKNLKSYKRGGTVRFIESTSYLKMLNIMCENIEKDISEDRDVAVLCRVNSDGILPALLLDKLGDFSFSISGDGMTLDSYTGRLVVNIVRLFTDKSSSAVGNSLKQLTWDRYMVDNLMKVLKANKGLSIWNIDSKDLSYSCPDIAKRIMDWRNVRENNPVGTAIRYVLADYRINIFSKDTKFNSVVRSVLKAVETLFEYFDYDDASDFLFELQDINERLKARKKKSYAKVKIATVHEFKGKEADSVYVWNDSEEVFPIKGSEMEISTLEEERRIHYIACTRARLISTIVYKKNAEGMFVQEMNLDNAEDISCVETNITGKLLGNLEEEKNFAMFEAEHVEDDDSSEDGCESASLKGFVEEEIPDNRLAPDYVDDINEFWNSCGESPMS